jgi:hypothetical protein
MMESLSIGILVRMVRNLHNATVQAWSTPGTREVEREYSAAKLDLVGLNCVPSSPFQHVTASLL